MASFKPIPKKKSGRVLVRVRALLLKQLKFEAWLLANHPMYFDPDRVVSLKRRVAKLDKRIQRAVDRERVKQTQLVIS